MTNSSLKVQVGGDHYKKCKIQPVEYIHANGIGFMEGSAIKYLSRHRQKNGRQDVEKALHFCQLLLDLEYPRSDSTKEVVYPAPEKLLDGKSPSQDLQYICGYIWAEGNQRREMPSEHILSLVDCYIKKWKLPSHV